MIIFKEKQYGKTVNYFTKNVLNKGKKIKSPKSPRKLYKRGTKIEAEEPFERIKRTLREEDEVTQFNIKDLEKNSIPGYESERLLEEGSYYPVTNSSTSQQIFDNYANAMTRKRDYLYYGLPDRLDEGPITALKDPDSLGMVIGQLHGGIFHPSHFAPENIKNGVKLMEMSKTSKTPIMYTVPRDLSEQLVKVGHTKYGTVKMPFGGEMIDKDVVGNPSFTKLANNDIEGLANKLGVSVDYIKSVLTKTKEPVIRNNRIFKKSYNIDPRNRVIIKDPNEYLSIPRPTEYPIGSIVK